MVLTFHLLLHNIQYDFFYNDLIFASNLELFPFLNFHTPKALPVKYSILILDN